MEEKNIKDMQKPSAVKFLIIIGVVVLCCAIAGIAVYKKSATVEPKVSKEDTKKQIEEIIDKAEEKINSDEEKDVAEEVIEEESDSYANEDYIIPDSDSRYLSESDLEYLSKDELRIARNEIYARHGRLFADEGLQAYFDSKDWYYGSVDPDDFKESMLNDYEVENAYLISDYEKEMGYR